MTFEVRPVRPVEYVALGEITVAAYLTVGEDSHDGYLDHVRDIAARAAICPVLVAIDADGRVLGGVSYVPGPGTPLSESEADGEAGFRMLAVDPPAQGRGVGRALVEACIARARAEGRSRLVLLTRPRMTAAHGLYEAMGFRRAPERDCEPEPGIDLVGFVLDLLPDVLRDLAPPTGPG
jgi:ribosomal protein S18 acetylase RimI-like enzyme